jgi:hypothetical protein
LILIISGGFTKFSLSYISLKPFIFIFWFLALMATSFSFIQGVVSVTGEDRGGQAGPWPTPKSLEVTKYID